MRIINPPIIGLEYLEADFIIPLIGKAKKFIRQDYATFAKILFHSKINKKVTGAFGPQKRRL